MKKSRFLWIRDLPAKCRDTDLRSVLERHGSIQKIRLFKEGHMRHAVVTFVDIKSATAVINTENKINDTLLKVEYCDSADITGGIINHKSNNSTSHRNSEISNQIPASLSSQNNNTNLDHKTEKELNMKNTLHKGSNDSHHPLSNTDHLGRGPLIFKRTNSNPSNMSGVQMFNQVLRPVQSSALTARMSNSYRGLKISDLPPSSKLSDAYLRQSLFTEFRRCGRIQSIVLPPTNGPTNTTRLAIVTFRRAEEAECAYQAIQGGAKILFSTPVSVELHPGSNGNDELPVKRSSASNALFSGNAKLNDNLLPVNALPTTTTTTTQSVQNKTLNSHSTEDHTPNNNQTTLNKSPTRTLYVAGLTVGPTGPVTSEQLTTAFRKFGDIINVQLKSSSNSALIQFAEMRGPIRAMNAHAREPLRLGGRPLSLAYTPSTPTTCLWVSDLPPSLVSLSDEELLHTLSQIAPVQEIALINRNDQNTRAQSTPSISASSPHCAAYIKLNSTEHAIRLLTELRSGKQYSCSQQSSTSSSITTAGVNKTSTRRPIAVDFASPRQSSIVANLQLNVSRSSLNSHRVRIISSSNVDRWESSNKSINSLQPPPSASSAITTLTSKSIDSTTHSVTRSSVNIVKTSTYRTTTISQTSTPVTSGLSSSHNQLHLNNSLSDVVTDLKKNNHIFVDKQSDVPTKGSSIRRSSRSKSSINQSNILSDRVYHELSNNRLKRSHDTSPSSLSTSSSSSSTSTSSDSSSSSSSSSISSTSISSSGSSMSASSGATSHRRNKTSPTKSNHKLKSIDSYDNKHSIKTSEHTSSSQCNPIKIYKSSNNNNKVKEGACLKKTDSFHSSTVHSSRSGDSNSSWLTDAPSDSSFIQQPLRVMTMNSSVLSPIRSSAASSGGLSSPGGSSSSIIGNNSLRKTPNTGLENVSSGCQSEFVGPSPNHHSSLRLSTATQPLTHTPTALIMGEFRVSPTLRACSVSASSGVSSGGPSFSSTNSSGGGSTGSSPLTSNNSAMSNCQSIVVSKSNCGSQIKVTSSSPSLKRNIIHIGQSNGVDTSHTGSANKSRTFSDSTSSFKVHLSSNSALASSSPGSRSPSCMSSTTTPLTVSIKLAGITRPSQPSNLVSPCSLSENNDVFTANQDKQSNDSLPLTPVSAPPLGCKTSRHASTDPRRRSIGVEAPVGGGTNNDMTDWWSNGSPVYESMYDKIKRRTNKEAEERRQRQLEAFTSREKKNRKQRKKEQLTKSPPSNSVPISSPDSFSNEQCGKINAFSSNGKSHHSVSSRCKLEVNNRSSNKKHTNRQKSEISSTHSFLDDDNNHLSQWHSTHTHTRSDRVCTDASESHLYSRRMSRNMNSRTKRRRSVVSSLSSSLSSEGECNSNSPPETLTRLSLGMRFPVSATYHECIDQRNLHRTTVNGQI
ncbi:unnamed protein product [Heterobilharzia americana]|nr:unnamed protein product [Heterobilharzia americana]